MICHKTQPALSWRGKPALTFYRAHFIWYDKEKTIKRMHLKAAGDSLKILEIFLYKNSFQIMNFLQIICLVGKIKLLALEDVFI